MSTTCDKPLPKACRTSWTMMDSRAQPPPREISVDADAR